MFQMTLLSILGIMSPIHAVFGALGDLGSARQTSNSEAFQDAWNRSRAVESWLQLPAGPDKLDPRPQRDTDQDIKKHQETSTDRISVHVPMA